MLFKNTLLPVSFFAVSAIASPLDPSAGAVKADSRVIAAAEFMPALMANGPAMAVPAISGGGDPQLLEALKKAQAAKGAVKADSPVQIAGVVRAVKADPKLVEAVKADPEFLEALKRLNKANGGDISPEVVAGLRTSDPALFEKIEKLKNSYVADKRIVAEPQFVRALKEVVPEAAKVDPKVLVGSPKTVVSEAKVDPKLVLAVKNVHEANGRVIKGHQANLNKQADILRMQAAQIREHGKKLGAAVSKANASLQAAATLVTVTTKTSTSTTVVTPTVVFAAVSPTPSA